MSDTDPMIGIAVIELVGGSALNDLTVSLQQSAGKVAGVWRANAPASNPDRIVWIEDAGETVPVRRRVGGEWLLSEARADIAVLIEDTTILCDGWDKALQDGFSDDTVGCLWGPVEISPDLPARFRALGRLEYGRFANGKKTPPAPPGNVLALSGALLARHLQAREGLIEAELAATMTAAGQHMIFDPAFRSIYSRCDLHGARLATRFQHGRLYASQLASTSGSARRAVLAVKGLLAPAMLSFRALKSAYHGGGAANAVAEASWIVAMAAAWGLGECCGALSGPGQSRRSWR